MRAISLSLVAVLASASLAGSPPAATAIRITLSPPPPTGTVVLHRIDREDVAISLPLVNGSCDAHLPTGSRWTVTLATAGWWMPSENILVDHSDTPIVLSRKAWPTGVIRVRVNAHRRKFTGGETLRISVEDPPIPRSPSGLPKSAAIDCPISVSGEVACEVPAAIVDVALRIPGFVPAYHWALDVKAKAALDLGTVSFRRGASISGWVTADETSVDLRSAHVRLVRLIAGGDGDPVVQERLTRPVAEAGVLKTGFFQLSGIPEGTYRLVAEQSGSAPAVIAPLIVYPDAESALRVPLRLSPPVTIRVAVEPSQDWLGRPWNVRIEKLLEYSIAPDGAPILEAPATDDGSVEIEGQAPGTFRAFVLDDDGNTLAAKTFAVSSAADSSQQINVKFIRLEGHVRRGKDPVSAELWFGGRFGETQIRTDSNGDGVFEAVLPAGGEWLVSIEPHDRDIAPAEVQIDIPDRNDEARVTLQLPTGVVVGRVFDESGRARQGARVSVVGITSTVVETATDGSFRTDSIAPGRAMLNASSFMNGVTQESTPLEISVPESGESGPYDLRLMAMKHVRAVLVSQRGPIAGASVYVYRSTGTVAALTTDVDGKFSFDVPAGSDTATLVAAPPGHALRAYRVPLDGRDLIVHAVEVGGTIRLQLGSGNTTVSQDGLPMAIQNLFRWSISQGIRLDAGGPLVFPNLSPGVWRFCAGSGNRCKDVSLAPGAQVDVSLGE